MLKGVVDPKQRTTDDIAREKMEKLQEYIVEFCRVVHEKRNEPYYAIRVKGVSFGRSSKIVDAVKQAALDGGYVFEFSRAFLKRETGRPPLRFSLLEKGFEILGKSFQGGGKGIKQFPFVCHIRRYYEEVEKLKTSSETFYTRPDVSVCRDGNDKWLAVEVSWSTGVEQEIKNIKRDLKDRFENIIVVPIALREVGKNSFVVDREAEQGKAKAMWDAIKRELYDYGDLVCVKILDEFKI